MRGVKRPIHPVLAALFFPLSLYSANAHLIPLRDVFVPALAIVAGSLLLWLAAYLVVRDGCRSAAVASVLMVLLFTYSEGRKLLQAGMDFLVGPRGDAAGMAAWAALGLAALVWAGWKGRHNEPMRGFLNVASLCGCLVAVAVAGFTLVPRSAAVSNGSIARSGTGLGIRPDVFYIVLDGYGREDVLRDLYGVQNRPFLAALKAQGFRIADRAVSNAVQTEISLASSLNMAPISALPKRSERAQLDRIALDRMIDDSLVSRLFRAEGYAYIAVTTGFPALEFRSADYVHTRDGGRTLFVESLAEKTPFASVALRPKGRHNERRALLRGGFDVLQRIAKPGETPRFVIAHILAPHPPFVFGPNGEPRDPALPPGFWDGSHFIAVGGMQADYRSGYADQLAYLNQSIAKVVDAIVQGNPNAIVILQGDHGPKSELDQGSLANTNVREAFGILLAIRGPKAWMDGFGPESSPVNVFRNLFRTVFGYALPPEPDRSFYSTWESPLEFTEVFPNREPSKAQLRP